MLRNTKPPSECLNDKRFNGKPMSHWQHLADKYVVAALVRAAYIHPHDSIILQLASKTFMEMAKSVSPKLITEVTKERNQWVTNVNTVLKAIPKKRKRKTETRKA